MAVTPAKKMQVNPSACYLFPLSNSIRRALFFVLPGFDVHQPSRITMHATSAKKAVPRRCRHSTARGQFTTRAGRAILRASRSTDWLVAVLAYAVTKESNMMLDYELAEETAYQNSPPTHDIVVVSFHGGAEGV